MAHARTMQPSRQRERRGTKLSAQSGNAALRPARDHPGITTHASYEWARKDRTAAGRISEAGSLVRMSLPRST